MDFIHKETPSKKHRSFLHVDDNIKQEKFPRLIAIATLSSIAVKTEINFHVKASMAWP